MVLALAGCGKAPATGPAGPEPSAPGVASALPSASTSAAASASAPASAAPSPTPTLTPAGSPPPAPTAVQVTLLPSAVPSLDALAFPDPAHGWAAGAGAILATADGGRTWRPEYTGPLQFTALDFTDPLHGWAVAGAALLRTTDGGATWTRVGTLPGTPLPGLSLPGPASPLSFWDAESGYAVTPDGGLAQTNDGGAQWSPERVGLGALTGVAFVGGGRYGCVQSAWCRGPPWPWVARPAAIPPVSSHQEGHNPAVSQALPR